MNDSYCVSLARRHASADASLRDEMLRPSPDPAACSELKKRKLAIKDRMVLAAG